MTDTDLAYLAGIIDGEGTVVHGAGVTRMTALRVAMTDKVVIDWLQSTFGGTIYTKPKSPRGKAYYEWTLQGQDRLLDLIPQIIPYALCKRPQLERMIDLLTHLRTKPSGYVKVSQRPQRRKEWDRWKKRSQVLREKVRDAR